VGKGKLQKFEEMGRFPHVVQPPFEEVFQRDHSLKGKWNTRFFPVSQPLVLELGCGKGEYTVGLAKKYPDKNFLGVDIKGARMWKGAKNALEAGMSNVGFLRTRIEFITSFFAPGEVSEIWLTFPDPQLKRRRNKKRLTTPRFLNAYRRMVRPGAIIHLKTDSRPLYTYTLELLKHNRLEPLLATDDLYGSGLADDILSIRTFYETRFLEKGLPIHYLKFSLDADKEIIELPDDRE